MTWSTQLQCIFGVLTWGVYLNRRSQSSTSASQMLESEAYATMKVEKLMKFNLTTVLLLFTSYWEIFTTSQGHERHVPCVFQRLYTFGPTLRSMDHLNWVLCMVGNMEVHAVTYGYLVILAFFPLLFCCCWETVLLCSSGQLQTHHPRASASWVLGL